MYSKLNSPFAWIVTFFLLLFIYTKLAGPIPLTINSVTTTKSDTFQVTGTGKAAALPDIAFVTVGVSANGQTVKIAQDLLNTNINKVSSAIKKLGINEKDIETANYNINPTYDYREGNQKTTGYLANSNLHIKIREIDKTSNVIDAATENGANQVGGISFNVDNKSKLENEARQKAVEGAKKKAEDAAKIAGFKIGKIINYSESFGGSPIVMSLARSFDAKESAPTQVEPGSSEVIVNVTLSYEIQ